jgi:hypothetical protein
MTIVYKVKGEKIKFLLASGDWGTPSESDPIGIFGRAESPGISHELKYDLTPEQEEWTYYMCSAAPSVKWDILEMKEFPKSLLDQSKES